MAILTAWQTRSTRRIIPTSSTLSSAFLVVRWGLTIKDGRRALQTNGPDSYYVRRELVPIDRLEAER
jgi:type III restriction enzyme